MKNLKFIKAVFFSVLFLFALCHVNASGDSTKSPTVRLPNDDIICGKYVDVEMDNGNIERGIQAYTLPYAETMTGEKRWTPAVMRTSYKPAPFDASSPCPACPQVVLKDFAVPHHIREDCLYLNIWTPSDADACSKYPVMVYIHGGGFMIGSGNQFDGSYIAAYTGNTVVVTINYRLYIFGFLVYHAEDEDPKDSVSGNFGLLDQRLALRWVRKHIKAFGGDPGNVTIFGESAGAMSIGFHLMMNDQDHFDAAIMESNPYSIPYLTEHQAAKMGKEFIENTGCQDIQSLRNNKIDYHYILKKSAPVATKAVSEFGLAGLMAFRPVICDKTFCFPSQPLLGVPRKPIMIGTNRDEGELFWAMVQNSMPDILGVNKIEKLSAGDYKTVVKKLFGKKHAKKILRHKSHKPRRGDHTPFMARLITDFMFTSGNLYYDHHATKGPGIYAYHFTRLSNCNYTGLRQCLNSVCHTEELPYVFHRFHNPSDPCNPCKPKPGEKALSNQVIGFWTSFAKNRAPGAPWPKFKTKKWKILDDYRMLDIKVPPEPVSAGLIALKSNYWLWKPIVEALNSTKCKHKCLEVEK